MEGRPERIRLRGRDVLEIISDVDEIGRLLQIMTEANPRVATFVGIANQPGGRLERGRLETAVRYGFRIIRWHLGEPHTA